MAHGLAQEVAEIRDMVIEWDSSYTTSLGRGYIVDLFEKHGLLDEFKAALWASGNTPAGDAKLRRYRKIKQQYDDFLARRGPEVSDDGSEGQGDDEDQQFAAEADLRDFLAKNPGRIEAGLQLYSSEGKSGVEYAIDGGFIDLLMLDRDHRFVVIELKVGRGRNRTIGQLLYYMGWVDNNLGMAPCRGMIIVKEISDDLKTAVQRVPDVSLHQYSLSVAVQLGPLQA
jgi:hypothetical protein